MKTTREERKEKAVELMKTLDIYSRYINAFKSKGTKVCFFENYAGFYADQEPELQNKIKELEERYDFTIYAATHDFTDFGELYSFLIVPSEKEDWHNLVVDEGGYAYAFAYVWNVDDDYSSEFGDVVLRSFGGGVKRIG